MKKLICVITTFFTIGSFAFRFYSVPATVINVYQGTAILETKDKKQLKFYGVPDNYKEGDSVKVIMDNRKTSIIEDDIVIGIRK